MLFRSGTTLPIFASSGIASLARWPVSRNHASLAQPSWKMKASRVAPPREAQSFKYEPLNPARNDIRLLRIRPNSHPGETISCELFHTSLDDAPPYQALSYAWGERGSFVPILTNHGWVNVTPNLKHALQRLRPKDGEEDLIIWVDAICINQQDIPERNFQTGKMRMIYRNAQQVPVWIGLENNNSKGALQFARDLNKSREKAGSIIDDPLRRNDIEALVVLFRRPYWWRIWVVQEISCAKETTIYCGEDSIPWQDLENTIDIMRQEEKRLHSIYYKHPSKIRTLTHGGPRSLQVSRYSSPSLAEHPPLLELLLSHKSKKSTDPKDKVYALVGISSTRKTFGDIDYSLTMRAAYAHATRHIIATTRKLDVICVKQHDIEQFKLPSWAPDWTRAPASFGHPLIGLHHHEPAFKAAGDTLSIASFTPDGYGLRAQGFVVDRIKAVGTPLKKQGPPSDITAGLQAYEDSKKLFFGWRKDTIESRVEFGRVISCGNWTFDDRKILDRLRAISDLILRVEVGHSEDAASHLEVGSKDTSALEIGKRATSEEEKAQMAAILSANLTMNRRRLFISADNVAGQAPWNAEVGDRLCILLGCSMPVILRPWEGHYKLIGEAYVHGCMDGEAFIELEEARSELKTFEIH